MLTTNRDYLAKILKRVLASEKSQKDNRI